MIEFIPNGNSRNGGFDILENGEKIGECYKVDNGNGWYAMNMQGKCFCSAPAPNGDPTKEDAFASMQKKIVCT